MHEIVQRHMESMTEELEEMKRTKLFTAEEIKWILKTRKDHEYKVNGISKHKQDFEDYIRYEKVLLRQIQNRRDKFKIAERKNSVEFKILKRIRNIYEIALQRFSTDFPLYLSYFKFCKQSNFISVATIVIENMLKHCTNEEQAWVVAAGWYARDRDDLKTAIQVLNKGLTTHKESRVLFKEVLSLEMSVVKPNEELEENMKQILCEKLQTYINFICRNIKDSQYLVEILNLIEVHSFTTNQQNAIIKTLVENYADKEFVWHTLAQREKRGLHYGSDLEKCKESGETSLTLCFAKYQEGLKKVSLSEKEQLWSKYLDCLIEAQQDSKELSSTIKMNLLKTALQQASNEKFLSERYYILWIEIASDDEALDILEKGTSVLPESIDLWKLYLRYATMMEKTVKVRDVFNRGIDILKEKSLPLWFMCLRYYTLLDREDIVDKLYQRGIQQPPEISHVLKPRYLEWLTISKGIAETRKVYNVLADEQPYCKELHVTMCKIESLEIKPEYDEWERVHEKACKQFGELDVDVWINYILFFIQFNKTENLHTKVQAIQDRALNSLSPFLQSEFRERFAKTLANE